MNKETYLFKDLGLDIDIAKNCETCGTLIYKNQYRYCKLSWKELKYCSEDCMKDGRTIRELRKLFN